jgi:hypothetical protein
MLRLLSHNCYLKIPLKLSIVIISIHLKTCDLYLILILTLKTFKTFDKFISIFPKYCS